MTTTHPLQVGGTPVLLAGRRPDGKVLVASANRFGRPLGGLSEVHAHQLRGTGWHMAAIKAAIAALPLIVFAYDQDTAARGNAAAAPIAPTSPRDLREPLTPDQEIAVSQPRGFLHAHHTAAED